MGQRGRQNDLNFYRDELTPFRQIHPAADLISMTSQITIREPLLALKAGASDTIYFPVNPEKVGLVTENIVDGNRANSKSPAGESFSWNHFSVMIDREMFTNWALLPEL